jgi:hypothetical protein
VYQAKTLALARRLMDADKVIRSDRPHRCGEQAMDHELSRSLDEHMRFAIANKRLIQLRYGGKLRVAEPHDYGVQRGTAKVLVYQLRESGGGHRSDARGWRLLDVLKIEAIVVLEETFHGSRGESHHRHYVWDAIYARVA